MKLIPIAAGAAAALLAAPAVASAHITVNPREAAAGSFSVMTVRVPNERDNKGTVKVDLRLPNGFYFASYKKVPGWNVEADQGAAPDARGPRRLLGRPPGDARSCGPATRSAAASSGPTSSRSSTLSVRVPDGQVGSQLVFRAFQTYRGGERVRWTGAADSEAPAPRVTLTAAVEDVAREPVA